MCLCFPLAQGVKSDISNNKKTQSFCAEISVTTLLVFPAVRKKKQRGKRVTTRASERATEWKYFMNVLPSYFPRYSGFFRTLLRLVLVAVLNFHALSLSTWFRNVFISQNCASLEELLNCRRARLTPSIRRSGSFQKPQNRYLSTVSVSKYE